MIFKPYNFPILFLMLPLVSCYAPNATSDDASSNEEISVNNSESENNSSSVTTSGGGDSVSSEIKSDDFNVSSLPFFIYPNQDPEPLLISGTDRLDEIEYDYDGDYLSIVDNKISAITSIAGSAPNAKREFEVTAKLGNNEKTFVVTVKNTYNREGKLTSYKNEQTTRGITKNKYTLVLGDSFFDYYYDRGWSQIYSDIDGDIFDSGVAASTFEEWFYYAPKLIYDIAPKYIAMHLGTNDFWDLRSDADYNYGKFVAFVERIHAHCPNTKIVYFSIENRGYVMPNKTASQTLAILNDYNAQVKAYCDASSFVTFVDSFTHFTNSDGSCNTSLFYDDNTHPLPSEHSFYIEKMIENGIDNISLADNSSTPSSFTRSASQGVGVDPVVIKKNNASLHTNFVASGSIQYSYNSNSNAHFEFGIGTHASHRLLLWNNVNAQNKLNVAAVYDSNYEVISTSNPISGTSGTFTFKLLISEKSVYLFVNDSLKGLLYNYIDTIHDITLSSEMMNVNATNITINQSGDGSNVYETLLATLSTYENDTSTTPEGRVID